MKKYFLVFVTLIVSLWLISPAVASTNSDLAMEASTQSKTFSTGSMVVLDFRIRNVGSNPISPSPMNYFLIAPEFEVIQIKTIDPNFYCPVNHVLKTQPNPSFDPKYRDFTMLGCTTDPSDKKWQKLQPEEFVEVNLTLKVIETLVSEKTTVFGFQLPDVEIENSEAKTIEEFYYALGNEGDIAKLETNNLTRWIYQVENTEIDISTNSENSINPIVEENENIGELASKNATDVSSVSKEPDASASTLTANKSHLIYGLAAILFTLTTIIYWTYTTKARREDPSHS